MKEGLEEIQATTKLAPIERASKKARYAADKLTSTKTPFSHTLIPFLEHLCISYQVPWLSPTMIAGYYAKMIHDFADSSVAATDLVNKLTVLNIDSIQSMSDTVREYCRPVDSDSESVLKHND